MPFPLWAYVALDAVKIEPKAYCDAWQGGGCEWEWGNDCTNRCNAQALNKSCKGCSVHHYEDSGNCIAGWQTCECYCSK
ncbi:hypothetical protein V8F33_000762 [Rhypophila sp. PSN 637]